MADVADVLGPPVERRIRPAADYPFTPATYPGPRPRCSFVFAAGLVRPLEVGEDGGLRFAATGESLSGWLRGHYVADLDERTAVLGYGSNLCPGRLSAKGFHDLGPVVVVRAVVSGLAAAWCAGRTTEGNVPATVVAAPDSGEVHGVTFLDGRQLACMDASEGRPDAYALAELEEGAVTLEGGWTVDPLLGYVDASRGVLSGAGGPLLVRDLGQRRVQEALDAGGYGAVPSRELLAHRPIAPGAEPATRLRP